MQNRNSLSRRSLLPGGGSTSANSSLNNYNNSSAASIDTNTTDSNKRHSIGRSSITSQPKVTASPNRNSVRLSKGGTDKDKEKEKEKEQSNTVSSPAKPPPSTPQNQNTTVSSSSSPQPNNNNNNNNNNIKINDQKSPLSPPPGTSVTTTATTSPAPPSTQQSQAQSEEQNNLIKVCVRVRPFLRDENESPVWQWKENQITPIPLNQRTNPGLLDYTIANPNAVFSFDHLFTPEHSNIDIFDHGVKEVVASVMNGYHGSVFTYGQTSSGKTFTMYGGEASNPQVCLLFLSYFSFSSSLSYSVLLSFLHLGRSDLSSDSILFRFD
jgi:centromeric protein E